MKIILITGSHPRHKFIANKIAETGNLDLIISQKREPFVPQPPENLDMNLSEMYVKHFNNREKSENLFFGNSEWPLNNIFEINKEKQNSIEVYNLISKEKPDLLISYGCGIISDEIINLAKKDAWNIHGGLSPWYKGGITLFWPSYMLEPQMTGMTIHTLTNKLDAGDIIHQCAADLVRGDGIHDLACRAVFRVGQDIVKLINIFKKGKVFETKAQKTNGKLWIGKDWRPEHLKLIYEFYNDNIVDMYLDGHLTQRKPKLHQQFTD